MIEKLSIDDVDFFNKWRQNYHELSNDEQFRLSNELAERYPTQKHFNEPIIKKEFEILKQRFGHGITVLEVGGWKGELADTVLRDNQSIDSWVDIDICSSTIINNVCLDQRYKKVIAPKFNWFETERKDPFHVCVCAHTIEHLTFYDLLSLVTYLNEIPTIIFEAPISHDDGETWNNYQGTHILEVGWDTINKHMCANGYVATQLSEFVYRYERLP